MRTNFNTDYIVCRIRIGRATATYTYYVQLVRADLATGPRPPRTSRETFQPTTVIARHDNDCLVTRNPDFLIIRDDDREQITKTLITRNTYVEKLLIAICRVDYHAYFA